jgi:hypothetical protein
MHARDPLIRLLRRMYVRDLHRERTRQYALPVPLTLPLFCACVSDGDGTLRFALAALVRPCTLVACSRTPRRCSAIYSTENGCAVTSLGGEWEHRKQTNHLHSGTNSKPRLAAIPIETDLWRFALLASVLNMSSSSTLEWNTPSLVPEGPMVLLLDDTSGRMYPPRKCSASVTRPPIARKICKGRANCDPCGSSCSPAFPSCLGGALVHVVFIIELLNAATTTTRHHGSKTSHIRHLQ